MASPSAEPHHAHRQAAPNSLPCNPPPSPYSSALPSHAPFFSPPAVSAGEEDAAAGVKGGGLSGVLGSAPQGGTIYKLAKPLRSVAHLAGSLAPQTASPGSFRHPSLRRRRPAAPVWWRPHACPGANPGTARLLGCHTVPVRYVSLSHAMSACCTRGTWLARTLRDFVSVLSSDSFIFFICVFQSAGRPVWGPRRWRVVPVTALGRFCTT